MSWMKKEEDMVLMKGPAACLTCLGWMVKLESSCGAVIFPDISVEVLHMWSLEFLSF